MVEYVKEFKQIDSFLIIAKTIDTFQHCQTVYDLFGIKNKNLPYPDIEKSIQEFVNKYSGSNAPKFKNFGKTVASEGERIKRVLKDHREEYNDYLRANDPQIKQLRQHFDFCTKRDGELDSKEKSHLVEEGKDAGLTESETLFLISQWVLETGVKEVFEKTDNTSTGSIPFDELLGKTYYEIFGVSRDADYAEIKKVYESEYKKYNDARDKARANARWVQISEGWEILKDKEKRRLYNEKIDRPPEVDDREPVLKVISDMGGYVYKDVRKGKIVNQKIVIKNCGGGQLKGKIVSNVNWLVLERDNLTYKHEQTLEISVQTSKIPVNTYDTKGSITIDTNGGPPYSISFRVILEDLEIAAERFKKTYVPLIAVVAGFIFSFSKSPVLNFVYGAVCAGVISFLCAKLIVEFFLNEGIDIFQFPPVLIQAAAVGVFFLTIMSHSGGGNGNNIPQNIQAPAVEAPAAPAAAPAASAVPLSEGEQISLANFVLIRGGEFTMGSHETEVGRSPDEAQHQVRVSDFYMDKYEVTVAEFRRFVEATGYQWSKGSQGQANHPVVNVSWNDAVAYCKWLSQTTGKQFRLPTEAEWEYACRAGSTTPFNTGENLTTNQANYNGNYPYDNKQKGVFRQNTVAVNSFVPNAFGLYNMHGNVWEWTDSWYDSSRSARVIRGGSWYNFAMACRSAFRYCYAPGRRGDNFGFRLVFVP